jgi:two-component system sensor histidine kinase KdpD
MVDSEPKDTPTRGVLRIYLGAAPGVGKTVAMLDEGTRRRARGTDVVVGDVESHDRPHTAARVGDLEVIPRLVLHHRGRAFTELDVDAVIARQPKVALVDELAHTNVPGSRNAKRWQDVFELLDAGIDVISTVNIQHLESLKDVVEGITGVRQREVVPDHVVRTADQIELVDMAPEALQRRMAHGNVYPAERVDAALANYFRLGNLSALRELALLWVADRVDDDLQDYMARHGIDATWETKERVVVALTGSAGGERLIRRAARVASRARAELIGVHVLVGDGLREGPDDALARHRQLLADFDGTYREIVGTDVAQSLIEFTRSERGTQLVVGAPERSRLARLTKGSIVSSIARDARSFDLHVVGVDEPTGQDGRHTRQRRPARSGLSPRRLRLGWAIAVIGLPAVTPLLAGLRNQVALPGDLMLYLLLTVVAAAVGGIGPAVFAAAAGSLAANWYFTPPLHTLTISDSGNALSLAVFVAVGVIVAQLVTTGKRQAIEARRAGAEAESLSWAIAALAGEGDPVPGLLHLLRTSLDVEGIALFVDPGSGGALVCETADGAEAPDRPGGAEMTYALGDGSLLAWNGKPLDVHGQRIVGALAAQITSARQRKLLEAEAAQAEATTQTDALRTALLRSVSHDLRTPLASIKASVSSLLQDDVHWSPDDVAEFLTTIDQESDRLNHLIGNLLDMSRLQAGAVATTVRPVAPEEIVALALRSLSHGGASVSVSLPSALPLVDTDGALVERALANVIDNAVGHNERSTPVRLDVGRAGDVLHLRVIDRGSGVPRADRDRLFEPFQQLDDHHRGGVGLGLAVARGFVQAVGGTIDLEDTPGGGLTVDIGVPIATPPVLAPDAAR